MSVLVAGIGNIFLGDDAFGVEVINRLSKRVLPKDVQLVDFGIRGFDLANALLDCGTAVLVDAMPRGGQPGTLLPARTSPRIKAGRAELRAAPPGPCHGTAARARPGREPADNPGRRL